MATRHLYPEHAERFIEAMNRHACGVEHLRPAEPFEIRSIVAVGAIRKTDDEGRYYLEDMDESYLAHTVDMLTKLGYRIAEDFTLDAVNLSDGRDFLLEKSSADLIVLCRVYQPGVIHDYYGPFGMSLDINQMTREQLHPSEHNSRHYSTFAVQENWQRKIEESGCRLVINYSTWSDAALTSDFVCGQNSNFIQINGGKFCPFTSKEHTPGIARAFEDFEMAIRSDFIAPKLLSYPTEENFPLGRIIQWALADAGFAGAKPFMRPPLEQTL